MSRPFRATVQDFHTSIKVLHNLSLVVQMKARRNQALASTANSNLAQGHYDYSAHLQQLQRKRENVNKITKIRRKIKMHQNKDQHVQRLGLQGTIVKVGHSTIF